jgi:nucleotide-binding universal stress UspA family protein
VYANVVIALAPTQTAREAYDQGVGLARALGANVHLVCAFDDGEGGDITRRHAEGHLESAQSSLHTPGMTFTTHALSGDPAEVLVRVAEDTGADLLVVGNKGAQGARRLLGSVASTVLAKAPCAVMVVHTT